MSVTADSSLSPDHEGAYRRGFHQAIAAAAAVTKRDHPEVSKRFSDWELNEGMKWRKDQTLALQITPPPLRSLPSVGDVADTSEVAMDKVLEECFSSGEGVLQLLPNMTDEMLLLSIKKAMSYGKGFVVIPPAKS